MFLKNFFFIKQSHLKHGFFTRLDGLSKKQFRSLNCSSSNDDDKKNVVENRLIAIKNLNLNKKKLILITQTHSSKVIRVTKNNLDKPFKRVKKPCLRGIFFIKKKFFKNMRLLIL